MLNRPAFAQDPPPAAGKPIVATGSVRGQTTWDERYLYVVLTVDDPDVLGTNTLPLSEPQKDDSVAVYVHTGAARGDNPDENTHAMLVSAAGGFTFLAGDSGTKAFAPKPIFSIKYGSTILGTLNRSDDTDRGYITELAIPWKELGVAEGSVKAGMPFAINIVVRDRTGKSFSSLAPNVKTDADTTVPSKWVPLVLAASESADIPAEGVFAPPVPKKGSQPVAPLIDGVLKVAGEWPAAGKFTFVSPVTTISATAPKETPKPVVVVPVDNTPPALTLTAESLKGLEPLVFARYLVNFQGDGRKITPFQGTFDGRTGRFLLADEPLTGTGPWFSSDRASWHRGLLYEMRRNGVDSALVSVGGPDAPMGGADGKALYVLAEALREMTQDGLPTPKVSLELNTSQLSANGATLDVSTPDGQARLYASVRRFFAIVPPQFRSRVTLPVVAGGVPVYPVFFSGAGLTGTEGAGWTDALRKAFAEEFGDSSGGASLLFVGGTGFDAAKSPGLVAGGVPFALGGAATSGIFPAYVVQAGVETGEKLTPRKNGETYKAAWDAALAAKPKWYILDSWNDFARGTELVASRQYGTQFLDLTRIYTVQTGNLEGIDLRWRTSDVPRRLRVGQTAPIFVSVQNGGGTALRPEDGYALSYRWKQGDKVVAEAPLRNRLQEPFLPTQTKSYLLGLTSLLLDGSGKLAPLPPGDYSLEIDFIKLKDGTDLLGEGQYLAETGVAPLVVPVSLYSDERQYTIFEETTTPALLQAGASYPLTVKVRYMGPEDLPTGSAALTWQLVSMDGKNVVATGSSPISQVLPSGVPVSVLTNLSLNDPTGLPVVPSFPELPEGRGMPGNGYKLRWLLTRTDSTDTVPGELMEQVAVYAGDEEARFPLPEKVPDSVSADTTFTIDVPVVNRGTQTWKKAEYVLGSHWYYSDGVEARWKPLLTTPLPKDVAPGEEVTVKLLVRSPETDGAYILVPDIARLPDDYLSTRPVSRIGDISPIFLRVTGGRLNFVDLTKAFNVDGIAYESKPADGDLDERGGTFPAESFPPDRFGLSAPPETSLGNRERDAKGEPKAKKPKSSPAPAYPSGYYADYSPSARRIAFRYGSSEDGAKNAIAAAQQTINLPKGSYVGLHLAATATGGQTESVPLVFTYADKTTETITVSVRDWSEAQSPTGDTLATMTRRKRTPQGDEPKASYLRHIIASVNIAKELVSVTLPDNLKVKIFAMTLDR
ncbi:MAG: hypothetical protein H8F28_09415 [Fibrella sp.]|nr:hypothetical protein [Armatimonadota bacterium]